MWLRVFRLLRMQEKWASWIHSNDYNSISFMSIFISDKSL